ncbi:MAG: RNHCP domain-containing protein [Christensenellaceae bacterium]|jgi:ribosome biogenesis GTPase|nr:RNHCP domain-containing protein [Christensenellaceae bacterium]
METKKFRKNDAGFICAECGAYVAPLLTSSRDHCTNCLCSLHVDNNPGDRANACQGVLYPVGVTVTGNKGTVINYHCASCGAYVNCKMAPDDNYDKILEISSGKKWNI